MNKFNSRKFYMTIASLIGFTILLCTKTIDQAAYSNLFMFVFGGYSIANLAEHKSEPKA